MSTTSNRESSSPARKPATKRVTIYDLARHTGFSPGTVSRVLNNRDKVKPATRERILNAAKELDLKPQVSVRTRQVAILSEPTFSDRIEGYAAELTAHLSFAFSRKNIGVVLPSDPVEQLPGMFLDGVIAVTYNNDLVKFLEQLEERYPVVYMDKFEVSPSQYRVYSDHYRAGYLAAQHFVARGKRKLAYFGGRWPGYVERLRGYKDAMKDAGVEIDERLLVLGGLKEQSVVVTRLVRSGADCIYVPGTSMQALECLHILTYVMGMKVPDDISIIGGENEGISEHLNPPLTTIEEPLRDMAAAAVDMLDSLTAGNEVENHSICLPIKLIERNSV